MPASGTYRILGVMTVAVAFALLVIPRGVRWVGYSFEIRHELYNLRWYVSPTTGRLLWSSINLGYLTDIFNWIPFTLALALALFILRAFRREALATFRTSVASTILLGAFFVAANLPLLLIPPGAQAVLLRETAPFTLMIGVLEAGRGVVNPSTFAAFTFEMLLLLATIYGRAHGVRALRRP